VVAKGFIVRHVKPCNLETVLTWAIGRAFLQLTVQPPTEQEGLGRRYAAA